ncbi:LPS export ABC transporter permease LptF [Shimia ponticola]|uniref:LPS export ABC transporter permease LptF n=1 Tax=Shimia ponticola TaxID=2582893 RepID=UPI002102CFE6|nr:LPS export ABC transporter permease LptF [Shimia ponticola]
MARFDRYMLSECVLLFGFFSLLLVLVFWINRAVALFDRIIADGQSARVFLELSALQLPYIILLVLPISAFAAVLQVANRMSSDSELTIMQATGYSSFRLARPVLYFSLLVALMVAVLTHVLVPISSARLADRQQEISDDSTARLLREGEFLHPNNRSALYVRELTPEGELRDVFLSQRSADGTDQIYTSKTAFLLRGADGPQIVMIDGLAQSRDPDTNRLFTTAFDDFVVDVATLTGDSDRRKLALRELDTRDLWNPTEDYALEVEHSIGSLKQELHERLSRSLFPVVTTLLGFAVLLSGRFSRFGVWRQIGIAVALLIALKVVEGAAAQRIQDDPSVWFLAYLPFVIGMICAGALLWNLGRRRRVRQVGAALT